MQSCNFCNFINNFLDIFQSFRSSNFKTPSWEHLWWSLEEFWVVDYSSVFFLKCDFARDYFFNILEMGFIPTKKVWQIPVLVSTYNISQTLPVKLLWKILRLKHIVMVFKLRKKDPTRHVLKTKLSFKSFRTYLRETVCVGILILWSLKSIEAASLY